MSSDPNQIIKRWFYRILKFGIFAGVLLSFYLIYLDAWVQSKMTGPKWQPPVKVFARPLQLYDNLFLPKNELAAELRLLNYRKVKQVKEPGQYQVNGNSVVFYRRDFVYQDGLMTARKLKVEFSDHQVSSVYAISPQGWHKEVSVWLDPLLISRSSGENNEDRDIIDLVTVPEWMIDTLITVEDKNFYHHYGVSPFAIARAFLANLRAGRSVQGGSTLTQQLAKNLLLNDSRKTYLRKFKEALVALILDYRFAKDEILEAYFNEIYLGQNGNKGVHGFALASQFYFSKPLSELEKQEFALLVAIVKGPSYYNPFRQKDRAKKRRDLVLQLMVSDNVIDAKDYERLISKPMVLNRSKSRGRTLYPAYMQQVENELAKLDLANSETEQGILVFTGLDPLLQNNYEKLFDKSVSKLEKKHKLKGVNGAIVSIELDTASISALVGDRKAKSFGFNRALDTNRNIGSLIKPVVYLTALEQNNYNFASSISNQPITMRSNKGKLWHPQNYDKTTSQSVWLYDGLVKSMNLPTVHLGMDVGLRTVSSKLRKLGVSQTIPNYPSLLLGALSMSPLDVAKLYQPIANFGQKLEVSAITSVLDADGIGLWQRSGASTEVSKYSSVYVLNHGLNKVTREGTAKRLGMFYPKVHYAGKTGTTDDLRDSWFTGFDQNKLTTIWIGKDDNSPVGLTGNQGALTVFIELQGARKAQTLSAPKPGNVEIRPFDLATGQVLEDDCGEHKMLPIQLQKVTELKDCPGFFGLFN